MCPGFPVRHQSLAVGRPILYPPTLPHPSHPWGLFRTPVSLWVTRVWGKFYYTVQLWSWETAVFSGTRPVCCAGHVHPRNPRGRATQRWGSPSAGGGHWLCVCPPPPRAAPRDRSSCLLCCSTCKHNSVFSTLGPPHCRRRLPGLVMSPLNFPKIQTKESFFIPLQ